MADLFMEKVIAVGEITGGSPVDTRRDPDPNIAAKITSDVKTSQGRRLDDGRSTTEERTPT